MDKRKCDEIARLYLSGYTTEKIKTVLQCSTKTVSKALKLKSVELRRSPQRGLTIEQRFWKYTQVGEGDECWLWEGASNPAGYGRLNLKGQGQIGAHRYSYELHSKEKIPEGMIIRHTCDNPKCVNPHHLLIGDHLDNINDAKSRDRHARGERVPQSKLTEKQVREIRHLLDRGVSKRSISNFYCVGVRHVGSIGSRSAWAHI